MTGADAVADGLRLMFSRPAGAAWLLHGLWKALDVDSALRKVLGGRRFTTDVERVLFALVANRAIDPASKLAAAEWASYDVAIPGLKGMDEDQAYRAMDLLVEADTDASVQEAVFFAVADLLNLEVDLLFFDTTSTYFERDTEDPDPDGEDGAPGFRRYGHSKDHRKDLPQIVIGLAVTREGIPVRCWCWPGNTNDQAILPEVRDGLRGWRLGRVVTVVDRGFPPGRTWPTSNAPAGTTSPANGCATGTPPPTRRSPARAATSKSATTCGSRKSGSTPPPGSGGSSATTPTRPNATRPPVTPRSAGSLPSWTGSPPPAPGPVSRPAPAAPHRPR